MLPYIISKEKELLCDKSLKHARIVLESLVFIVVTAFSITIIFWDGKNFMTVIVIVFWKVLECSVPQTVRGKLKVLLVIASIKMLKITALHH